MGIETRRDIGRGCDTLAWVVYRVNRRLHRLYERSYRVRVEPSEVWTDQDIEEAGVSQHCYRVMLGGE